HDRAARPGLPPAPRTVGGVRQPGLEPHTPGAAEPEHHGHRGGRGTGRRLPHPPLRRPARSRVVSTTQSVEPEFFVHGAPIADDKAPAGPINERWATRRFEAKLVNPANRRKRSVIMVGTGLAGGAAAATLGEAGYHVKTFAYQDSPRRAHSI